MTNNLRIVYDNIADSAGTTLLVSSTASSSTVGSNLLSDLKGLVWRSATTSSFIGNTKANIVVGFTKHCSISCLVFAFTNFSAQASARIKLYSGSGLPNLAGTVDNPAVGNAAGNTLVYDSGVTGLPLVRYTALGEFNWGYDPLALTGYEDRKGYSVIWLPEEAKKQFNSMAILLQDPGCSDHYLEISRLIIGTHWSPTYNTGFGLSFNTKDLSTSERNEAGDLITTSGATYNNIFFDLQYMNNQDRNIFNKIVRSNSVKKPMFISLFPENSTDYIKENLHQIYGKLVQSPGISHPVFDTYSSQVEIEEV